MNGISPTERLLGDIIETVREPLLVLDAKFRVIRTNRAFFDTFRATEEETIGTSLFSLGDGQWDIPPLRALLEDRLLVERELFDVDVDHVFPGIGRRIMLLNARLVAPHEDNPRITLLAIEDVTAERLATRRLTVNHRELQRSNSALSEFAFVASHDLQEPLRKILSFGERLSMAVGGVLEANPKQYLDRMLDAAARMRTLVSDLLTYSQVAASTEPYAPTDLGIVAREVIADLEAAITESRAVVDVGALPTIEADAAQMRQLLQNLLSNAIKFRHPDTAPVIRVHSPPPAGDFCTIIVADNGIGIKDGHRDKIYGMFERLHTRAEFPGSGIGLALCKRIVERHGGMIGITTTLGGGTTFSVRLPVTQPDVEYTR